MGEEEDKQRGRDVTQPRIKMRQKTRETIEQTRKRSR